MINRNASRYVSIIYDGKWLLRVFFSTCLQSVCVCNVRYTSKYCVLSVFYFLDIQLHHFCIKIFLCAHTAINLSYLHTTSTTAHPILHPYARLAPPLPLSPCEASGAAHLQNFFIFLFFKSHDTINSQYYLASLKPLPRIFQ